MKNLLILLIVFSYSVLNAIPSKATDADDKEEAKKMFVKGYKNHMNGNLKAAEKNFTEAIAVSPSAELYYKRGLVRFEAGKMSEAIADYENAITLNPSFADAYNHRGIARLEARDTINALKDHDKAIELNPNYADAYYQRGYTKTQMGHYEEAIKDYDKAIDLSPEEGYMFLNRSMAYYHQKKFHKAFHDANTARLLMPENPLVYKIKAVAEIALGHKESACESIENAIDLGYTEAYGVDLEELASTNCK